MMIDEFRKMQKQNVKISTENYKLVEFVYTYHPLNFSKETVVNLYEEFGEMIFLDLLPRAKRAAKAETELTMARVMYENKIKALSDSTTEEYNLEI